MKKILPLLCGITLILTGCDSSAKTAKPIAMDKSFCKNVVIQQDEKEYSAELKRGGDNTWECTFSAPETVNGMVITYSGDSAVLNFMGLSYSLPREEVPEYGITELLTSTLEIIINGKDISCVSDGETTIEKGVIHGQDFSAEFQGKNLKTIEISKSFKAEFS